MRHDPARGAIRHHSFLAKQRHAVEGLQAAAVDDADGCFSLIAVLEPAVRLFDRGVDQHEMMEAAVADVPREMHPVSSVCVVPRFG